MTINNCLFNGYPNLKSVLKNTFLLKSYKPLHRELAKVQLAQCSSRVIICAGDVSRLPHRGTFMQNFKKFRSSKLLLFMGKKKKEQQQRDTFTSPSQMLNPLSPRLRAAGATRPKRGAERGRGFKKYQSGNQRIYRAKVFQIKSKFPQIKRHITFNLARLTVGKITS